MAENTMESLPSHEAFRGIEDHRALDYDQAVEFLRISKIRIAWEETARSELKKQDRAAKENLAEAHAIHRRYTNDLEDRALYYVGEEEPLKPNPANPKEDVKATFVRDPEVRQAVNDLGKHLLDKWAIDDPPRAREYRERIQAWVKHWNHAPSHGVPEGYPPDLRIALRRARKQQELMMLWTIAVETEERNEELLLLRKLKAEPEPKFDQDHPWPVDGSIRHWEALEQIYYYHERALDILEKCASEIMRKKYPTEDVSMARIRSWLKWVEVSLQRA